MKKKAAICLHHPASRSPGRSVAALALSLAVSGAALSSARADLVTAFNFNGGPTSGTATTATLASTSGQTSAITTTGIAAANLVVFGGTTVNAVGTDVAGVALAVQGGTGAAGATGGNNGGSLLSVSLARV